MNLPRACQLPGTVVLVEFHLFGAVEVINGGTLANIGRRRERGLLALLLADVGRSVPADWLLELLCEDNPPARPRKALQEHVSRLRTGLAAAGADQDEVRVVSQPDGYTLYADPESVDIHRFARLVADARRCGDVGERAAILGAALALCRGPLCADLTGRLRDHLVNRLEETVLAAQELRVETELALGRHHELVAELADLTARHPTRERLVAARMLALYRCGRGAEALVVYQSTARHLADLLGVDPNPDLRRLHTAILRDEPVLAAPEPPHRPVPAQLPHDVAGFTGRAAELTELTRLFTTGAPGTIRVVDGPAGIGKTALAVHFAHRVADRFPDGQLYLDLRGFDPTHPPMPATEALGRFLRALGVEPEHVPEDEGERAALYRSTLAGRRVLVVLDNASSAGQVRPLLPGAPGCRVVVTTRNRLDGLCARDGARRVTLDVLTPAESTTLLAHVIGATQVAAEPGPSAELVRLCGYLPLAVRIAAERASTRPSLTLTSLVEELAATKDRLDLLAVDGDELAAVRSALSWSYQALDSAAARVFRLLGVHAGPDFSDAAAAAVTGRPLAVVTPLLDNLSSVHLLEHSGPDRRRFHDLVRIFAAERASSELSEPERDEAVLRSLTWYLHTADAAGRTLLPLRRRATLTPVPPAVTPLGFDSHVAALAWCETEAGNLTAATHQAATAGHDAIAWRLPVALWDFLMLRRYRMDWLAINRLGLSAARRLGDRLGAAGVLTCLSHGYWETRQFTEARTTGEAALAIWRELGDRWGEGVALHLVGGAELGLGRVTESVERYRQALATHREIGNQWGTGWTLTELGSAYRALGRYEDALEVTEQALTVWRRIGDRHGEGTTWNNLADTYRMRGQFEQAGHGYRRALEVHRASGNRGGEAWAYDGLGRALRDTGQFDAARESWHRALAILTSTGDPRAEEITDLLGER